MSSGEDDEFGGLDDEALMLIATQAERQGNGSSIPEDDFPEHRASKRRRLNDNPDYEEDSDGDNNEAPTTPSQTRSPQNSDQETETLVNKPKSKYKIHIPKQAQLPQDTFFTQVPPSSQSPYRIRGCYWQKQRPKSPLPAALVNRTASSVDQTEKPIGRAAAPGTLGSALATLSSRQVQPTNHDRIREELGVHRELASLPSDAFASSAVAESSLNELVGVSTHVPDGANWPSQTARQQRLVAPQTNMRQTTLFGGAVQGEDSQTQTQTVRRRNWPAANREEPPTHHKLDRDALQTWVYPTNLGTIRDYQFNIVARGLYHNLLVALPTGLGKTFIAATIMLNWYRWTDDSQIVFVAPTKPLASQQVEACFKIAGIPYSDTTLLTGNTPPGIRAEEWLSKRVFFMTPQTIVNDLKSGIADPKRIVLLVVDEAHRATGSYAYVEVVKFLRRFSSSFRVLALTATPGASVEAVQEVIDGLGISRVEIRTEESLDIRQYVFQRNIDSVIFQYSEEIVMVMDLFAKALQPTVNKLCSMSAYWNRDPMTLTPYGCTQARQKWMASDAGRKADMGTKGMVNAIFSILASLAHSIELLKFHGIGPFFHKVTEFRDETRSSGKGSKYRRQIDENEHFDKMMTRVGSWVGNPNFVGHPKLDHLQHVVLKHFVDAGDGKSADAGISPANTRVMVFVHYRDSAEEVARVLRLHEPMIRPHVFVGQANSKGSDGMDQKTQLETIHKFKTGVYNTLVATSIGEEGLDIGEVDLIICYDASASPIRMLQRMGRTGRKRAGNIIVFLVKGKEESNFSQAKDNYEKMQQMIAAGTRFTFHEELAPRIVPKDIQPVVDKRIVDIPFENTQADLPEPKRRAKPPKRPPKKFHMPDGVRKGFTTAAKLDDDDSNDDNDTNNARVHRKPQEPATATIIEPEPIPSLESVLLTAAEEKELERTYLDVGGDTPQIVKAPRLDAFPSLQRSLRYTKHVRHGRPTKRIVNMLAAMHGMTEAQSERYAENLHPSDKKMCEVQAQKRAAFFDGTLQVEEPECRSPQLPSSPFPEAASAPSRPRPSKARRTQVTSTDVETGDEDAYDAGSIIDFIDDEVAAENKVLSSASSPPAFPSPTKPNKLFYEPSKDVYPIATQSGDELPDFSTLVGREKPRSAAKLVQYDTDRKVQGRGKRKVMRRVVESDSDEE